MEIQLGAVGEPNDRLDARAWSAGGPSALTRTAALAAEDQHDREADHSIGGITEHSVRYWAEGLDSRRNSDLLFPRIGPPNPEINLYLPLAAPPEPARFLGGLRPIPEAAAAPEEANGQAGEIPRMLCSGRTSW
ncbi:hypothetical protein NL676_029151 [Syzygium grande]|nr:hypothetical protein NL676_029151 [Syzygium grande]